MAAQISGGIAPDIVLAPGYILRVTALNPTTGAVVAGVMVSDVNLQVLSDESSGEGAPLKLEPPVASFGSTSGAEAPGLTRG